MTFYKTAFAHCKGQIKVVLLEAKLECFATIFLMLEMVRNKHGVHCLLSLTCEIVGLQNGRTRLKKRQILRQRKAILFI